MRRYEALYASEEMRAAEARYAGTVEELMERAGHAVARIGLELFAPRRRWAGV